MKLLTLEEHRQRIRNLNDAEKNNRQYLRRHRVREYLPAQATYNLGDYPARFSMEPTEYDYNMLKDMAENGVQMIQLHEEWNDAIRRFGADKFSSFDKDGYVEALATSEGGIRGPWSVDHPTMLSGHDGGHGMLFTDFDGQQLFVCHQPNQSPKERPALYRFEDGVFYKA